MLMDWERQSDWMLDADSVVVTSRRREGVGVTIDVRTRLLGIAVLTEPMVVTRWEPPSRLTIRHGSLLSGTGTWELRPRPGGTLFTWTEDVRLGVPVIGEPAAWLYRPVLKWLMGRAMKGLRAHIVAAGPRPARGS